MIRTTATVANPRPHRSGGWFSFTMPTGEEVGEEVCVRTEPEMDAFVGRYIAPGVVKCWAKAPALDPYEHMDFTVELEQGQQDVRPLPMAAPTLVVDLGDSQIRHQLYHRDIKRVDDTQLVAEFYTDGVDPIAHWELLLVCSDNTVPDKDQFVEGVYIESEKPLTVYDAATYGAKPLGYSDGKFRWQLLGKTSIADAQGLAWHGASLDYAFGDEVTVDQFAALSAPLECVVHGWHEHWGPFGVVPEAHPSANTDGAYWADLRRYADWVAETAPDPWTAPRIGMGYTTADTGDQEDFGASSMLEALRGGPLALIESRFAALAEARRPGHYRMPSGEMLTEKFHNGAVCWGQALHYHTGVSPYQHGKMPGSQPVTTHGWGAWDNEHCSLNRLCGTYLLTGSYVLRRLIQSSLESWLMGATTKPGWSTTDRGEPRSTGRTLLAMAWAYRCTGDSRILARMIARLDSSYADLFRDYSKDQLYVLKVHPADGRYLDGKYPFWMPWQEALGIVGLDAAYRVTLDPRFRELTEKLSENWIRHGWWMEGDAWVTGSAVAVVEEGKPPVVPGAVSVPAHGTDFDIWALGALAIARTVLPEGDAWSKCCIVEDWVLRKARRDQKGFWRAGTWAATR